MENLLPYSMFQRVLIPKIKESDASSAKSLHFQRTKRFQILPQTPLDRFELVVFDFETTGLSSNNDRIIEVGAIRYQNFREVSVFSQLIDPQVPLSQEIIHLTGITPEDLTGMPLIDKVLPEFLKFIDGAILVAHNAEFDMAFLRKSCQHLAINLDWPVFCTLKLARALLPELDSKNLDRLASHYQLTFGSRHRSIGDVRVTAQVLANMLKGPGKNIHTWNDLEPYKVV